MRLEFLDANGFETAVYEWGDPSRPTVFCVHGLGGQGQNFAKIAEHLSSEFHVVAPDLIGRGRSQWATNASVDYNFDCYGKIVSDILARKRLGTFHWIGVSMGGALALHLANGPLLDRFKSLTLNDIGPVLDHEIADSIQSAVSAPLKAQEFSDLVDSYESMFAAFGMKPSDGRTWQDMALEGARRSDDGCWTLHFDTMVAEQFNHARSDFDQADGFRRLSIPIQVFWGRESAVLTRAGLDDMLRVQPDLQIVEVQKVGHAPLLDRAEDLETVRCFLRTAEQTHQGGARA